MTTYIKIATEDVLSEAVAQRLLADSSHDFEPIEKLRRGGNGYLNKRISAFCRAAAHQPFFVLTDLDDVECAPSLVQDWLGRQSCPNLIFRVAVREVESWIMADRHGFAGLLGLQDQQVPAMPDELEDPKREVLRLARRSRRGSLRRALLPGSGSSAPIGPEYNATLVEFVRLQWNPAAAAERSPSLMRTMQRLADFQQATGESAEGSR